MWNALKRLSIDLTISFTPTPAVLGKSCNVHRLVILLIHHVRKHLHHIWIAGALDINLHGGTQVRN